MSHSPEFTVSPILIYCRMGCFYYRFKLPVWVETIALGRSQPLSTCHRLCIIKSISLSSSLPPALLNLYLSSSLASVSGGAVLTIRGCALGLPLSFYCDRLAGLVTSLICVDVTFSGYPRPPLSCYDLLPSFHSLSPQYVSDKKLQNKWFSFN